ncbi:MAG: hypothetical protein GF375_04890 [Candidatus Omnitrophica bacterium]|nr:hypothetical protein [Candidatus Omnitrophota bacterium]
MKTYPEGYVYVLVGMPGFSAPGLYRMPECHFDDFEADHKAMDYRIQKLIGCPNVIALTRGWSKASGKYGYAEYATEDSIKGDYFRPSLCDACKKYDYVPQNLVTYDSGKKAIVFSHAVAVERAIEYLDINFSPWEYVREGNMLKFLRWRDGETILEKDIDENLMELAKDIQDVLTEASEIEDSRPGKGTYGQKLGFIGQLDGEPDGYGS